MILRKCFAQLPFPSSASHPSAHIPISNAEADPRSLCWLGRSALVCAVRADHAETTDALCLAHRKLLELPDRSGKTPLMNALERENGSLAVVETLIKHGADIQAKDKLGSTPINYLRYNKRASQEVRDFMDALGPDGKPKPGAKKRKKKDASELFAKSKEAEEKEQQEAKAAEAEAAAKAAAAVAEAKEREKKEKMEAQKIEAEKEKERRRAARKKKKNKRPRPPGTSKASLR